MKILLFKIVKFVIEKYLIMSEINDYPTFNIYRNLVSFDGNNIFTGCVTGDLFVQFINNKHYGLSWTPSPYKDTQTDIRKENFGLTHVAIENDKLAYIHKSKELWILKNNKYDSIENVEQLDETFKKGSIPCDEWVNYTNPAMTDDEKYVILNFINDNWILLNTMLSDKTCKTYVFDIESQIFYDVTEQADTDEFNYENRIMFVFNLEKTELNVKAITINKTDTKDEIQIKQFTFKNIKNICGSKSSKQFMIYKDNSLSSIPYSKLFTSSDGSDGSDDWTNLNIKFQDDKEFVTSIGASETFYIVVTYKNVYVKKIDGTGDWVVIPYYSESSFDIKTLDDNFYDVVNAFWVNVICVGDKIVLTSLDGKVYILMLAVKSLDNFGVILQTVLPQIMIDDCYTNKIIKQCTFLNKYKVEYSEFECKCEKKH